MKICAGKASPRVSWKNHGRDWSHFPRQDFIFKECHINDLCGGSEPLGKLVKPK